MTDTTHTTTHTEDVDAVAKLIKGAKVALLTTITASGDLHSRPLGVQDEDFDGELWFFTQDPSEKTADIRDNAHVNVSLESGKGFLSIAGTASVVKDAAKIDELWNTQTEAWFPEGREDPTVALIKVDATSAEYWVTNEPKVVTLFKVAKAAATGGQPDIGENHSVDL
ncbi:pyridoxamine 5'-phosphate oxidase family protein [Subtercola lobariae]|uniref:General stress protein n=1 Tax=Subtercola lobariae TaxID=1588641 RepID=A0A917EZ41_9MICO|nr:pyridoxamine 5'-phosphate oxidase family protein [Subtercola lobariae]GGF34065.1 general stress protein [Subtercola lobariae]